MRTESFRWLIAVCRKDHFHSKSRRRTLREYEYVWGAVKEVRHRYGIEYWKWRKRREWGMHRLIYIYASYLLIESFVPARWWESSKGYKVSLLVTVNWEKTTFLQWNRKRTSGNRRTGRILWRKLGRVMISCIGRGGREE